MRRLAVCAACMAFGLADPAFAQDVPVGEPAAVAAEPAPSFPEGARYGYIDIQRIAAESAQGQAANARVLALQEAKITDLNERNATLQSVQDRLAAGADVMSPQAIAQLQRDIERQQVDLQRFTEDAQLEVQALQEELFTAFEQSLSPVIQEVVEARDLLMLFDGANSGLIWAKPSLDLTGDIIDRLNQGEGASAPAPAP